jgi:hypothetical protein
MKVIGKLKKLYTGILEGYRKCTKGIGKKRKNKTGSQQSIRNSPRVSKKIGGYWKFTKGMGKLKLLNTGFQ